MVQWLRPHASTAGGAGSILGQGTKIPHAVPQPEKKIKRGDNLIIVICTTTKETKCLKKKDACSFVPNTC